MSDVDVQMLVVALAIFVVRVLNNALATMRLILITRGRRISSSVLAFIESLMFVLVIGTVVSNLGDIPNLVAYAGGFAVGGYIGMWLEDRLALGYVLLMAVSRTKGQAVVKAIREAGFGATEIAGRGVEGEVLIVESIMERHQLETCINIIQQIDPDTFITTQTLRSSRRGYMPVVRPGLTKMFNQD
jgi:uncharacterized protein YebE (UPF0316 family)